MGKVDQLLEDALIFRKDLQRAFEEAAARLANIEKAIEALRRLIAGSDPEALEEMLKDTEVPREKNPLFFARLDEKHNPQPYLTPDEVTKNARLILLDLGTPLKRGALVKAFAEKRLRLPGSDKNKNLGTILWRNRNQFVMLKGLGYWPRDRALEGIYEPSSNDKLPPTF